MGPGSVAYLQLMVSYDYDRYMPKFSTLYDTRKVVILAKVQQFLLWILGRWTL